MPKGTIEINIEGISLEQTERYREILHMLFAYSALDVKFGKTVLSWQDGALQGIEIDVNLFRKGLSPPLKMDLASVKIERTDKAQPQPLSGQSKKL